MKKLLHDIFVRIIVISVSILPLTLLSGSVTAEYQFYEEVPTAGHGTTKLKNNPLPDTYLMGTSSLIYGTATGGFNFDTDKRIVIPIIGSSTITTELRDNPYKKLLKIVPSKQKTE